ncbi:Aspercryptin biosynthesis cluster-specific transcription regulator atnN [Fusarium oxysporum f. sp. raphani]|uniref:Aspercryptin biosynthesis cluster-specific transcription regulator atnN n=1 Tax=Fusarium oxysporum f. sp. raphani TaxID=96318 RepID=A0A8J5U3J0_FUSOX|nr:Aspercryptin biosynthesis cluster-specific transcription regulator atnN [Fusarium oxysporum f. sp. raphani]
MKTKDSRKKRYATKGKTGCITCRIRRVRCDEDKPSCHRCTSTGRKCDGYDLATLAPSGRLQLQPMVSGGSDPESQAIYQFRTRIATLIASSFDADFWTYDVLHKSDTYTPVRHALAALASAYQKSILLGIESTSCDLFIFSQYQKAMKSLSTCFQEAKALTTSGKLAALVANFLFTMSLCWGGRSQQGTLDDISDTPSVCTLLRQLDAIHGQLLQSSNIQASLVSSEYSLKLWDRRFESLSITSQEEEKHVTALRMRRVMVEVTMNRATSTSDGAKSNVDTDCKTILDLALQLIHDLGLRPAQAGFYLANGLVEALYFVAVTSEDWDLRQQAIHILRQYRFTDGVWGSNAAADLAEGRLQRDIYRYRQQLEA